MHPQLRNHQTLFEDTGRLQFKSGRDYHSFNTNLYILIKTYRYGINMTDGVDIREFKMVHGPFESCHPSEIDCNECGQVFPLTDDTLLYGCPKCRDKVFRKLDLLEKAMNY